MRLRGERVIVRIVDRLRTLCPSQNGPAQRRWKCADGNNLACRTAAALDRVIVIQRLDRFRAGRDDAFNDLQLIGIEEGERNLERGGGTIAGIGNPIDRRIDRH